MSWDDKFKEISHNKKVKPYWKRWKTYPECMNIWERRKTNQKEVKNEGRGRVKGRSISAFSDSLIILTEYKKNDVFSKDVRYWWYW